ncbi:MAG: WbqC family protein [Planctomycetes bacterium]|nr:WbqC family protein [Planctomycetota bacterium]
MLLTAHQPNFLPYLGFFDKVFAADRFLVVDHVQFVKRGPFGWIHRNKIRTPDGWQWLTIPVLTSGKYTQPIREVAIAPHAPWRRKHLRSIEVQYGRAPHFRAVMDALAALYERPWERLIDFTEALISFGLCVLGREVRLERTSALGIAEHGTDLIIAMCRATGADRYLSGVHGRDYLDTDRIERAGIRLEFQDFQHPVYPQAQPGEFVPNLSWIDFAFCAGTAGARALWPGAGVGARA